MKNFLDKGSFNLGWIGFSQCPPNLCLIYHVYMQYRDLKVRAKRTSGTFPRINATNFLGFFLNPRKYFSNLFTISLTTSSDNGGSTVLIIYILTKQCPK